MNQKEIKAMKAQIVEASALNVGYYETVIPALIEKIDPDTFFKLMGRESGEWLLEAAKSQNRAEFQNILVSEAVKWMSYSDFKSIAHYFFNYRQSQEEILVKPLEVTASFFQTLQSRSDEVFYSKGEAMESEPFEITFETVKAKVLEDLVKAQSDFKQKMLEQSPTEIFDQASKILYVSDALFELEHFVEEFTEEDYEEGIYSYDQQLSALIDCYISNPSVNGSELFLTAAESAWHFVDGNYEVGSDDKNFFMAHYVANTFEFSTYLEAQNSKGRETTEQRATDKKSPTL
ncbi:hypothetical protein [Lactococcus lactis]|uniref:Uncharacterized protein n=1 Tax=Lactococcus lactis TaxID=1358 RepID=A0AAW5TSX8_9LACT|nr:hypothetical protein [Lactococcus lactis]MCW2281216.1 hypothetical protein [Lactococcus lactis]